MRRKSRFIVPFVLGLALVQSGVALAAQSKDQSLPIHITSNNANFAQKAGSSTYTGDVVLTRGGMTLTGNKLVVTSLNDRGNIKAVLTGNPAHIDKKPDSQNDESVTGHSDTIIYTNSNSMLTLRGHAHLVRAGGDTIDSPVITRNVDTGVTNAEGGSNSGQRVQITLQPDHGGS